jgi:hypothetical protein
MRLGVAIIAFQPCARWCVGSHLVCSLLFQASPETHGTMLPALISRTYYAVFSGISFRILSSRVVPSRGILILNGYPIGEGWALHPSRKMYFTSMNIQLP